MAPKSANELTPLLKQILDDSEDTFTIYEKISDLLAEICNESLNSKKIIGIVSYDGSPIIDEWEYKEGCFPFHIRDYITNQMVNDPRVLYIGKLLNVLGIEYYKDG